MMIEKSEHKYGLKKFNIIYGLSTVLNDEHCQIFFYAQNSKTKK